MADSFQSDIFKFVALRPPVSIEKKNQETNYIADDRKAEDTVVGILTKSFDLKDGTKIPEQVKKFIEHNKFDLNYPTSIENFTLAKIYEFLKGITKREFKENTLKSEIEGILEVDISTFLDKNDNQIILNNIWDRYYAFYLLARTENQNLDILTQNLRVFHFLQFIIQFSINDFDTVQNLLLATPLVSKIFTDIPKPVIKIDPAKPPVVNIEKNKEYKQLWSDLLLTHTAINEIKEVRFETKTLTETKNIVIPNKETGIEDKGKMTFMKTFSKANFGTLNEGTKSILKKLNLGENNFQISETVSKLQNKLQVLHLSVANINDAEFITQMPPEANLIPGIYAIIGNYRDYVVPSYQVPKTNIRSSIKPLGIGDLKVVKQKLKKYVAGEVAHIENVLRGEFKERKHRVLDRTEDIFTISNESNEETTKDTQTTERFELKNESEKTIQEKLSLEAGITVSGSYGMVKFSAHGDMAYSKSTQESNKNSSNFAREVIDKSVSKIQKKTKEERTTKKLHEVEEINNHGIDNKDNTDHTVGIYRWVDKYYEAQIYNYGKRMMFEFIIPEPSAFFEFAQTHKPKKNIKAPIVLDPNLTHKEITESNYNIFIRDYNVQGVTTPPVLYKTVSTAIVKDGMPLEAYKTHTANSKELIVPDGYIAKFGVLLDCTSLGHGGCKLKINIGNIIFTVVDSPAVVQSYDYNSDDKNGWHWFYPGSIIQISVNSYDITSYTINALMLVERMSETYENWQIQTFGKIKSAYQAMQMEYEQKIASQEVQSGIAIHGQNPRINREIERTELKKQCIKMLMDTTQFGTFDSMKQKVVNGVEEVPDFDIFDAHEEGKTIQFYEQAFEWENLTYLFYPYFWARSNQWMHKINTYDTDPLFTKFLQAGSARVVIPVHPAYNDAVMYFLENNGTIWQGGEPPRLDDPLFLSLADELRSQTDDLENAKPEGLPWEVILPTTLVYLQQDSVLPTF